jgi:hypothetical protein
MRRTHRQSGGVSQAGLEGRRHPAAVRGRPDRPVGCHALPGISHRIRPCSGSMGPDPFPPNGKPDGSVPGTADTAPPGPGIASPARPRFAGLATGNLTASSNNSSLGIERSRRGTASCARSFDGGPSCGTDDGASLLVGDERSQWTCDRGFVATGAGGMPRLGRYNGNAPRRRRHRETPRPVRKPSSTSSASASMAR